MPLRKIFFWTHLIAGIAAGLVILTMSLTGVLLAFERQIVAFAEKDLRASEADARKPSMAISAIVAAAVANSPAGAKPSNVTLRSDRLAPVTVALGRERTLFVNRYTGATSEGAKGVRAFFHVNEDLHRWLGMHGESRKAGKQIVGVSNTIFLFIVFSGLYIWIPKRKTRSSFRNASLFRGGLKARARDYNWHNVLGVWSFVPLVLIVFSGMVISYPWASALVYRAFGDEPPKPPAQNEQQREGGPRRGGGNREARGGNDGQLDRLWTAAITNATSVAPKWQSVSGRLPLSMKGPVTFAVDEGNGARPDKRSQILLDPRSGKIVEHKTYAAQSSGQKARGWLRFIHTGEAGGIIGQIVAAIASAAAVVLVWTGIALALSRLRRWLRKLPETQPNNKNSELVEEV
ncbi:MAG TPA: PepSY-associated TM helix domain-containing protein [Thermoanaerobaculia bacterium]|nr:PepSY-associated TM helix domain-containing protein [Thermoanaerobaculia bacterium]